MINKISESLSTLQILKIPIFEYCSVMERPIQNPILKMVLGLANSSSSGIIHKCPYKVI